MATPFKEELIQTAQKIGTKGKGILAADESTGTIGKRFDQIGLANEENNRRAWRELLFTTPGIGQWISGVILYSETLYQKCADGKPFVTLLQENGIVPGIKTDSGLGFLPTGENYTFGLDKLETRIQEWYKQGARFSKWRNVYKIDVAKGQPSELSIQENAWVLARQASISQANGLCPIVEPEVLADGTHDIEVCARVTERVQAAVVTALHANGILWEGCMLKPNMVTPGFEGPKVEPADVAWYTVRTLRRTIPAALPTVNFLSGGFSEEQATVFLNAINLIPQEKRPWNLSFSFGRALQSTTLKTWKGNAENLLAAQAVFAKIAEANGSATLGQYKGGQLASESLFVKNYTY